MTPPAEDNSRSDIGDDPKVASSRAGRSDGRDGTYVGRTSPDDSFDAGQTGAEARSERD